MSVELKTVAVIFDANGNTFGAGTEVQLANNLEVILLQG